MRISSSRSTTSPLHSPPSSPPTTPSPYPLPPSPPEHPSDIPRLRATHHTAGYREGLSASKNPALQPGFDEGYSLGAVLGLRVGELLGLLEGVAAALQAGRQKGMEGRERGEEKVLQLLRRAAMELELKQVFGRELWGKDGMWLWEVLEGENGEKEDVTFEEVVAAHPLVRKWTSIVEEVMRETDVRREVFRGEEWEAGRVGGDESEGAHAVREAEAM